MTHALCFCSNRTKKYDIFGGTTKIQKNYLCTIDKCKFIVYNKYIGWIYIKINTLTGYVFLPENVTQATQMSVAAVKPLEDA